MKDKLLIVAIFLGFAVTGGLYLYEQETAKDCPDGDCETLVEPRGSGGAIYREPAIEDRVVDLPEDGQQWRSIFVWSSMDAEDEASRNLWSIFSTDPALKSLLSQTKPYHLTPDHALWKSRYEPKMGTQYPQYWLCQPDPSGPTGAKAVFVTYGDDCAKWEPGQLAKKIQDCIDGRCPRPRPRPEPTPEPDQPDGVIPKVPIDEPIPDQPDGPNEVPAWVYLLALGLSVGAGALLMAKRSP